MDKTLISYCGLNCSACIAYLREKNTCPGCQNIKQAKQKTRQSCVIRNCEKRKSLGLTQCASTCEDFPCKRLKTIAKRYKEKYATDLMENLKTIEADGIETLLKNEEVKWTCKTCGNPLSMHRDTCLKCGTKYR